MIVLYFFQIADGQIALGLCIYISSLYDGVNVFYVVLASRGRIHKAFYLTARRAPNLR